MSGLLRYLPLALLLAAGPGDYRIGAPPLRLIPSTTPAGEQIASPGTIVATSGLGRPDAAIVVGAVTLTQGGETRAFARGDVLTAVTVPGLPGDPKRIFCEDRQDGVPTRQLSGRMLFGLEPMPRPTAPDRRYCLIDADADAFFERAVLLGATGKARAPFAIPKAEYGLIEGQPLGGEATVRIRYAGAGGEKGSVAFDLEAIGFGRMRALAASRYVVPIVKLPAHEIIAGAVLTVLAFDAKSGEATIIVNRDLAPGHIVLPEVAP